ncbi:MAG: hypothetical protein J1F16_05050 [Muribaculaceae bacterium]|nr:hypothetical protein [Muribaculaceae bacterium]
MAKENFDPHIPESKEEAIDAIEYILQEAENNSGEIKRRIISRATERQINDLKGDGILIDEKWVHSIETSAILHARRMHGNEKSERNKGQIVITDDDFKKIPDILENYDRISKSETPSRSSKNSVIKYEREYEDGTIYYVEEKRDGRKSLAFQTMYKKN